jgi:hypothetical protein
MAFNKLNHPLLGEIRPRFALKITCEPEIALEHLSVKLKEDKTVSGVRSNSYVFVKTPSWLAHYWSPEMSVRIEKHEYLDYTGVHCVVGPRQSVWVLFTLIYAAIALVTVFGGIFGIVQIDSVGSSSVIWTLPIGLVLLCSIFITSKMGQHKGRDEMLHLISFVYHSLDEITEVERVPGY